MKVLFVVEPFQVEPLGVAYLASSLKKKGYEVDQVRADDNILEEVAKYEPDVVAYSVTTGKHEKFLEINNRIKEHFRVLSVFGGSHPTYFPEMVEERGVDVVIRGEADKSFPELLNSLEIKRSCRRVVDFRTLEQNLDRLPFPDREFLYKYPQNRLNPIKNVITSRGCRFSCPYCFNSLYREFYKGQNWVRYRSPENVIKECLELKQYPLGFIFFQDDEFLSNPRIEELLQMYRKEVAVPFHCQIRIELLNENNVLMLKESGCTGVTFAVECGNQYNRKKVLCRNMSDEQILAGSELLHKYGLKIRTENMIGIPGENLTQVLETLDLNIKIRPTIGWASLFQPYPRLPLGVYAYKNGFWNGKSSFKESFFEDTVLETRFRNEFVNLQRLFGIICGNPWLRPFAGFLLKVPRNNVYKKIHTWWKERQYKELFSGRQVLGR